ncbi:MAG TPA: hypothetical protein VIH57_13445 [Bacteroidales bacterium]
MKTWYYLQDPFLIATEHSLLTAMGISTYHDSALFTSKGDPFCLGLYNSYHPLHLAFKASYDVWISQGGSQQGETLNLNQLLHLLAATKIQEWDIKIQSVYPRQTPEYKKLLPNRRKPFQRGGQTERIHAVQALDIAIGTNEKLTALKTDVDTFYTQLDTALNVQKGSFSTTKNMSSGLELARVAMCTGMYADLGALIQKFAATPGVIEQYFDLQAIRRSQQVLFTGHVKAGEIYTIVKHTFGQDDEIWLSNPGQTPLTFYLAEIKGSKPDSTAITLNAGQETVLASALGKLTNTFLTVYNPGSVITGEFEVELI